MMNIFSGFSGIGSAQTLGVFGASEPIGVPDGYGFYCTAAWIILTGIAAFLLKDGVDQEGLIESRHGRGSEESSEKSSVFS